jgi:2-succinyl-6-hydroxy-2,4-cyclohexadiene-1-carboxylate synthase
VWLGYSLGGRYALRVALDHPHRVRALITVGASPGLADEGARAARRAHDTALAAELVRDGVARFFDAWLARPMFAGLSEPMRFRAARERQDPRGPGRVAGACRDRRHVAAARAALHAERARPAAGRRARDAKFVREAELMARAIGAHAEVDVIDGAGHAAHLEAPEATLALVRPWLTRHDLTAWPR